VDCGSKVGALWLAKCLNNSGTGLALDQAIHKAINLFEAFRLRLVITKTGNQGKITGRFAMGHGK
jgi:hypothetical protein